MDAPHASPTAFAAPLRRRQRSKAERVLLYADMLRYPPQWLEEEIDDTRSWLGVLLTFLGTAALGLIFMGVYMYNDIKPPSESVTTLSLAYWTPPKLQLQTSPKFAVASSAMRINTSHVAEATLDAGGYTWPTTSVCQQRVETRTALLAANNTFVVCPQSTQATDAASGVAFTLQPGLVDFEVHWPAGSGVNGANGGPAHANTVLVSGPNVTVTGPFVRAASARLSANGTAVWTGQGWLGAAQGPPTTFALAYAWGARHLYAGAQRGLYESVESGEYAVFGNVAATARIRAITSTANELYVGGVFANISAGVPANCVAMWDGNAWSALGSGFSGSPNMSVSGLQFFRGSLYAAGAIVANGATPSYGVLVWDTVSSTWQAPSVSLPTAQWDALEVTSTALYIIAKQSMEMLSWDGGSSTQSISSSHTAQGWYLSATATWNDALIVAGEFYTIRNVTVSGTSAAMWTGTRWLSLGMAGGDGVVTAFASNATHLFAVGSMTASTVGVGIRFNGVAMYTAASGWGSLGTDAASWSWSRASNVSNDVVASVFMQQTGVGTPLSLTLQQVLPSPTGQRMAYPGSTLLMRAITDYRVDGEFGHIIEGVQFTMHQYAIAIGGPTSAFHGTGCSAQGYVIAGWGTTCCFGTAATFATDCRDMDAPPFAVVVLDDTAPVWIRGSNGWRQLTPSAAQLAIVLLDPAEVYSVVSVTSNADSVLEMLGTALGFMSAVIIGARFLKRAVERIGAGSHPADSVLTSVHVVSPQDGRYAAAEMELSKATLTEQNSNPLFSPQQIVVSGTRPAPPGQL